MTRALCPLIALLSCLAAVAQPAPRAIIAPAEGPYLTRLAATELQRYLHQLSGSLLPIVASSSEPAFVLGTPREQPLIRTLVDTGRLTLDPAALGEEGYVIRTLRDGPRPLTVLAGATPRGTLYAVYDLLERYGCAFTLGGDALPDVAPLRFLDLDLTRKPALRIRGSLPWYNFLDSPTTWNLPDYHRFFDQMAKMRMNFVGFHAYDYEPFTAVKLDGHFAYGQPLQNTASSVWGTVPLATADFGFGTSQCFARPYFGSETSFDHATFDEGVQRAQDLLAAGLEYARRRGIHVCVGFEVHGDPGDPVNQQNLEARLRHLVEQYPMLEYVWIWQAEGRGGGGEQSAPSPRTPFGAYFRQVRGQFSYLSSPARVAEAARVSYYAHLAHDILAHVAPRMRLVVSGWGGDRWMGFSDFYVGLDKTLPPDVIFSALDNIDPSWAPTVSHAYGELSPDRERWPIPWFESDGGGSRRDQWGPQPNVKPFTALCRDALAKGSQGLLGIHWRTGGVEEVAAYLAQFCWDPDLSYEAFYDRLAAAWFGPEHAAEMGAMLRELESLGPRWTGALGQVECGGFQWFSSGDRPKPGNLQRLAALDARLAALIPTLSERHRDRAQRLRHMIRWVGLYDLAALKLQPGGEVEGLILRAEQARAAGQSDAADLAAQALAALQSSGLAQAFDERAALLYDQGDMGVLATANGKAFAAYAALKRRAEAALGEPAPPDPDPLQTLRLAVTVTPDRLAPGEPLSLEAIARSDAAVSAVSLHWRPVGESAWREAPFSLRAAAVYQTSVSLAAVAAPGIEYYVSARDAAGRQATAPAAGASGPFSAALLAIPERPARTRPTREVPPAACLDLAVTEDGPYAVSVSWREAPGPAVHHWELWRCDADHTTLLAEPRVPGFVDLTARAATAYTYSVRPVYWPGETGPEVTVAHTTTAWGPPPAPTELAALPGVGRVQLRWRADPAGIEAFVIERRLAGGEWQTLGSALPGLTGGASGFCDPAAPTDSDAAYRVHAVTFDGQSGPPTAPVLARAWTEPQPVLMLPLNGDLTSPQGLTPDVTGTPRFVPWGSRQALQLGLGSWLSFPNRPAFDIPSEVSLECWVRLDRPAQMPVLIGHSQWDTNGYFLQIISTGARFHVALPGAVLVVDGGRVEPGKWTHLAGVFDGQEARVYQDGKLVGRVTRPSSAQPYLIPNPEPLFIGCYRELSEPYQLPGQLAEVAIYNGALSPATIAAHATQP